MEKTVVKPKIKFLAFLPKAATAIRFQNPDLLSPRREKNRTSVNSNKLRVHQNRGFSGPITSEILEEARSKSKNSRFDQAKEPTSPKISCTGQIKHKKKICKKKRVSEQGNEIKPFSSHPKDLKNKPIWSSASEAQKKKLNSRDMFVREKLAGIRNSGASADLPDRAPSLSQMKKFASGRNGLTKFDWISEQVSPVDDFCRDHSRYYSDEDRGDHSEVDEDQVIIPFSAPILIGGGDGSGVALDPRKEINLWKRRTMAQPRPLQLDF